jgi:uncharacterized protein YbaA (DUF1428 family)
MRRRRREDGQVDVFPRRVKKKPNGDRSVPLTSSTIRAPTATKVNAKMLKDKRIAAMMDMNAMSFDVKRMIYGGFKVIVA